VGDRVEASEKGEGCKQILPLRTRGRGRNEAKREIAFQIAGKRGGEDTIFKREKDKRQRRANSLVGIPAQRENARK